MEDSEDSAVKWNISGSQNFIAGSQQNFTQNNSASTGFAAKEIVEFVEALRNNSVALGLPEGQRDELLQSAAELEGEVSSESRDIGRIRAIAQRIRGFLEAAPEGLAQQMLLGASNQALGALLGG
ncbi:hypothetical protein [Streptomyces sp. NPDC001388]|uniref:hypothetical protein n=1 Tax=Streptomyces sp. NPDC001388 TaxID=3364568 RepID=UPI00368B6D5A